MAGNWSKYIGAYTINASYTTPLINLQMKICRCIMLQILLNIKYKYYNNYCMLHNNKNVNNVSCAIDNLNYNVYYAILQCVECITTMHSMQNQTTVHTGEQCIHCITYTKTQLYYTALHYVLFLTTIIFTHTLALAFTCMY